MFDVKKTKSKVTPAKRIIDLKHISVKDLRLVDTDTGEDITQNVIDKIPDGVETVDFKFTFEIDDSDDV